MEAEGIRSSGDPELKVWLLWAGKEAAFKTMNALGLVDISNNLGDAKSLITHPATTTHGRVSDELKQRVGITEGLIRVAVGLENIEDIVSDISRGLDG